MARGFSTPSRVEARVGSSVSAIGATNNSEMSTSTETRASSRLEALFVKTGSSLLIRLTPIMLPTFRSSARIIFGILSYCFNFIVGRLCLNFDVSVMLVFAM